MMEDDAHARRLVDEVALDVLALRVEVAEVQTITGRPSASISAKMCAPATPTSESRRAGSWERQ